MSLPKADAVMMDESRKKGSTQYARVSSILDIVEPLMGLDPVKGEKGYMRRQPGGTVYVSPDPLDTINYPTGHPKEGQPRYNWVVSTTDPGISLGYLKDKPAGVTISPAPLDGTAGMGEVGNA